MPTRNITISYGCDMSFVKRSKRNGRIYLNEVENIWIDGKCVQKHIRYIGAEVDGETKLAASISDIEIEGVKVFGPLIVLHHIAEELGLPDLLGKYSSELLSLVYAHCLNYKSINSMSSWFKRTDLSMSLDKMHLILLNILMLTMYNLNYLIHLIGNLRLLGKAWFMMSPILIFMSLWEKLFYCKAWSR